MQLRAALLCAAQTPAAFRSKCEVGAHEAASVHDRLEGLIEDYALAGLKDKRGFIDKDRLDLSERKAVEYWMKRWGVTRDQITSAHRKAGLMIKDIAAELGKKR